jgi:hypothetical protein
VGELLTPGQRDALEFGIRYAGRTVRKIERTQEFVDLVGVCHHVVAACGMTVPQLRGCVLPDDEHRIRRRW